MAQVRRIGWLLFIFCSLVYFITASGHIGGDGLWMYYAVESIVKDGDLDISNMKETIDIPELQRSHDSIREMVGMLQSRGHDAIFVQYGIGQILLEVPFYMAGHIASYILPFFPHDYFTVFAVSLVNIFVVALTGVFIFLITIEMYGMPRRGYWLALIFCFGTYVYIYAIKSGLSDPVIMLSLTGSIYYLIRFKSVQRNRDLIFAGCWAAFGILVKFYFFMVLPALFAYMLYAGWLKTKNFRSLFMRAAWFGIPVVIASVIFCIYNYARFGDVLEFGYNFYGHASGGERQSIFDGYFLMTLSRIWGLLFSPGKGLLFFAPVILLCVPGVVKGWRRHPVEMVLFLALFLEIFVFFASNTLWHGEWSWGPRYLIFVMPAAVIPAGAFFVSLPDSSFIKYARFFLVIGILIQAPAVLMNNGSFIRFTDDHEIHNYRLYLPQYSPIPGNYMLLFSGVSRVFTGESLSYPILYNQSGDVRYYRMDSWYNEQNAVSLQGYDQFDMWVTALWTQLKGKIVLQLVSLIMFACFVWGAYVVNRKLSEVVRDEKG